MKKILISLPAAIFISLAAKGQNLFFIDEQSYPSTETFKLQSNSDVHEDLNVLFAKDGRRLLFIVSIETYHLIISGKLIIYLDDGTVITLTDGNFDYVDRIASAVYYLTNEELSKMKEININTIRYTLEDEPGSGGVGLGTFTATNKENYKTNFPAILSEFFEE